ncbi:MAG: hypothetical protein WBX15_08350 [Thermoanaerobaculia bacterium]
MARLSSAARYALAFVAGFLSVLTFHQGALWLLHLFGVTSHHAWVIRPVPPFGIPAVFSLAFWGGLWGIVLIALVGRRKGWLLWFSATAVGAILPSIVAWFVVAPLEHQPIAGGGRPSAILTALIINAAWGLGTAIFARGFGVRS